MKKPLRIIALATPLALLAACGGAAPTSAEHPATVAELAAATPSMSTLALADGPLDVSDSWSAQFSSSLLSEMRGDMDHPHLFLRSEEVVGRVNRHIYKFLVHLEDAILSRPAITTGDTATWETTRHGIDARLTVKKETPTAYSWTLDLAPVASPAGTVVPTPITVASGTLDTAGATGPHQGTGGISLDLGKLASVTGAEVAGTIDAHFDNLGDHRSVSVHAADIVWDTDSRNPWRAAPRSADYVSYRRAGVGGSLKVSEEVAFPVAAAPAITTAQLGLVNRWYLAADKSVHGRSDAQFTGGQLSAAKVAKIVALTCHQGATAKHTPVEGDWLLKAEDASGATLWGFESVRGITPCDPQLGATVPALKNDDTDFDFSAVSFTDGKPYEFPGL